MHGDRRSPSFWAAVLQRLRLAWRLFWDRRVPGTTKLLPLAIIVYVLSPLDFLPDYILGLGQLDDVTLFLIGMQVFTMICPRAVVEAILEEMTGDVIDGEWRPSDRDRSEPPQLPKSDR